MQFFKTPGGRAFNGREDRCLSLDKQRIQKYLKANDFTTLFREELGWDTLKEAPLAILVDGQIYTLRSLVEKRGFKVYQCNPTVQGQIPTSTVMRQIERELTKHTYEHLIIFTDAAGEEQAWQWVKREPAKPSVSHLYRLHEGQSGELLSQKLSSLAFSIEEEDKLGTAAVAARVRQALDTERVTKKFYDRFQKEHATFLTFIDGIAVRSDQEWYASLMLNRLMFIYFIQKKGLLAASGRGQLDGDTNYLSHKLAETRQHYGEDQFYSFYRYFLLRLFHEGLGRRERLPELERLLGNVPYLNGGLFDIHQLEQRYSDIQIADEAFFEDEANTHPLVDLYNEKAGILDGEADTEVDLASQAYQIWKNATDGNSRLKGIVERLPNVVFSTRAHRRTASAPEGVLVYMRTSDGNDALAWINRKGENVTQSQLTILSAAACTIEEKPIPRPFEQHELVKLGVERIIEDQAQSGGGQLGSPSGARRRTYERLKQYAESIKGTLFPASQELLSAIDDIYRYPLRETARDTLNRQMRSGITDEYLAQLVVDLRAEDRLCLVHDRDEQREPQIICSLGLFESSI